MHWIIVSLFCGSLTIRASTTVHLLWQHLSFLNIESHKSVQKPPIDLHNTALEAIGIMGSQADIGFQNHPSSPGLTSLLAEGCVKSFHTIPQLVEQIRYYIYVYIYIYTHCIYTVVYFSFIFFRCYIFICLIILCKYMPKGIHACMFDQNKSNMMRYDE